MTATDKTLDLIERLRGSGASFCVVTIVHTADSTSARPGAKAVVTGDGQLHGYVGGGCVTGAVRRTALECLETGEPRMIRVKPKDEVVTPVDVDGVELHRSSCPSGGTVEIFLEPMRAARRLLICGASPIAQAIVSIAGSMGYQVIVAAAEEDRPKMPGPALYLAGFDLEGLELGAEDAAIIATQGKQDRAALAAVLRSGAGYKGMVCSRRKRDTLLGRLLEDEPDLAAAARTLHAPAGLHIGAIEPEEIALSVVAEIVRQHRMGAEVAVETAATG